MVEQRRMPRLPSESARDLNEKADWIVVYLKLSSGIPPLIYFYLSPRDIRLGTKPEEKASG